MGHNTRRQLPPDKRPQAATGIRWFLIALAMLGPMDAAFANAADSGPPLFTSKPRFRIPFQFDAAEMRRLGAVEINLYVSTDHGASWQLSQSVEPSAGKFSFEAPDNGDYWFAVRTIDSAGKEFPQEEFQPGLKVVVDEVPPTVGLIVEPLGPERVSLSWDIIDQNLDLATLRIEWRDTQNFDWQPLSILAAPSGQTSWITSGPVEVRASVSDLAGNSATAVDDTSLRDVAPLARPKAALEQTPDADSTPDFSKPVANSPGLGGGLPVQTAQAPNPYDSDDPLPVIRSKDPASYFKQRPASPPYATAGFDVGQLKSPETPSEAVPRRRGAWPNNEEGAKSRRAVRSRSFKIGYRLDDVGPSGVARVELYITEDDGRKWYHYGDDTDLQSPFDVVVPSDGEYGFAIRVQSGVGVVQPPPQPGDAPETHIIVDRSPPVAQILPLRQGSGAHHNQILIEWSLSDERLADEPVSLSYSEGPDGPWQPITGWTANTGRYVWTISERVRKQLYVKIEARDAAGNLTEARAGQPVLVDLSQPSARIVDVEAEARPR